MAYSSSRYSDKIPHGEIISDHLKNMGLEIKDLFKKEMENGYMKGATPENKIENFLGMVTWLETLMIPYVSEVDSPKRIVVLKEKYFAKRSELLAQFKKDMEANKITNAFLTLDEWSKILIIEVFNQGLMMRRSIDAIK